MTAVCALPGLPARPSTQQQRAACCVHTVLVHASAGPHVCALEGRHLPSQHPRRGIVSSSLSGVSTHTARAPRRQARFVRIPSKKRHISPKTPLARQAGRPDLSYRERRARRDRDPPKRGDLDGRASWRFRPSTDCRRCCRARCRCCCRRRAACCCRRSCCRRPALRATATSPHPQSP